MDCLSKYTGTRKIFGVEPKGLEQSSPRTPDYNRKE